MKTEQLPRRNSKQLPRQQATSRRNSPDLSSVVEMWLSDGKAQGFSDKSIKDRQGTLGRFAWWLEHEEEAPLTLGGLSPERIRRFLAYCREARPEGRFGSSNPLAQRQARPSTVQTYYRDLRAFLNFCVAEGLLEADEHPMRNVKAPRVPKDQVQPFTPEQVQSLLNATDHTPAPLRNRCIILTLLDTGLRVSELCSLTVGAVSSDNGTISVVGKGGKTRSIFLGQTTRRALRQYLRKHRNSATADQPLFVAEGGTRVGTAIQPSGIRQMVKAAGELASVEGVRCSPHTLRHSFAVTFLRNGGNLFELQQLMGHADLTILRRYVSLSQTDLAKAHRMSSPADALKLR